MSRTSSQHESFASRWSKRKIESETKFLDEDMGEVSDQIILSEDEIAEQKLAKLNALTDEDMPDLETLGEDSDYSGFMSSNVSETLRKLALQTLFHGKSYNIRDGLDEYDGDYTSFEKLDPSVITADMRHLMEVEAEKLLAKEKEPELEEEQHSQETLLVDEGGEALPQGVKPELEFVVADVETVESEDDAVEEIDDEEYLG
ncbi:MAG: DUF3306 domain-containing protein [Cocleimonas sp.]